MIRLQKKEKIRKERKDKKTKKTKKSFDIIKMLLSPNLSSSMVNRSWFF